MPGTYAHYRFGAQLLPGLRPEVRRVVKRHRALYDMGLHGPDIFFYHNIFHQTPQVKMGYQLHRVSGATVFTRAAKRLRLEPSEPGLAYLYGLLTHYCLDSHCHPLVHEHTDQGEIGHIQLETEFDRFFLETDGKKPPSTYDCSGHMVLTAEECGVIAGFYPGVTAWDVSKCVTTLRAVTKLLATPGVQLRRGAKALLKGSFGSYLMYDEADPACAHLDGALTECYHRAEAAFPAMEKQITDYLTCGVPLGREFEPVFG